MPDQRASVEVNASVSADRWRPQLFVIPITCAILVFLFALQHYGTHRVGFLFAPIILAWLLCMSTIGLYNIIRWNPQVYTALNPSYMIRFLRKTKKSGWMSLGGILLCMTGKFCSMINRPFRSSATRNSCRSRAGG